MSLRYVRKKVKGGLRLQCLGKNSAFLLGNLFNLVGKNLNLDGTGILVVKSITVLLLCTVVRKNAERNWKNISRLC